VVTELRGGYVSQEAASETQGIAPETYQIATGSSGTAGGGARGEASRGRP
jgi:hypothetical protein